MLTKLTGMEDLKKIIEGSSYIIITKQWRQINDKKKLGIPNFDFMCEVYDLRDV